MNCIFNNGGLRPSRALPYELHVHASGDTAGLSLGLRFLNSGRAAAVFHVYDRKHLDRLPRRYTVEPGKHLEDSWDASESSGLYDLWILGPNGFHRHFTGDLSASGRTSSPDPELRIGYEPTGLTLRVNNAGAAAASFKITPNAYFAAAALQGSVAAQGCATERWSLRDSARWYDFTLTIAELPGYSRRFAGRVENGKDSWSDPAQGGEAIGDQLKV